MVVPATGRAALYTMTGDVRLGLLFSMVVSRPAMGFLNQARLTRAVGDASQMGLRARGDGYLRDG